MANRLTTMSAKHLFFIIFYALLGANFKSISQELKTDTSKNHDLSAKKPDYIEIPYTHDYEPGIKDLFKQIHLTFKSPEGYTQLKNQQLWSLGRYGLSTKGIPSSFLYHLITPKDSVILGFYTNTYEVANPNQYYKNLAESSRWFIYVQSHEIYLKIQIGGMKRKDTIPTYIDTDKVSLYKKKQLKLINADIAGTYNMKLVEPCLRKTKCKTFFMFKKNKGIMFVYYLYNEGVDIDRYMNANIHMLKFEGS